MQDRADGVVDRQRRTADPRNNGFGFLRLVLASLVIIAHAPEIADGNKGRDPFLKAFGTITLGAFAVDCFFLISGYLVTMSLLRSPSPLSYGRKRFFRLFPGFAVAAALSVFVFAPLAGAAVADVVAGIPTLLRSVIFFQEVNVANIFIGRPERRLNVSLWTIFYEVVCYFVILLLASVKIVRLDYLVSLAAAMSMAVFVAAPLGEWTSPSTLFDISTAWMNRAGNITRLGGYFLAGSLFYQWRNLINYTLLGTIKAFFVICIALQYRYLVDFGVAIGGGYIMFAFAKWATDTVFSRIDRTDISYGMYLYAWPVGALIVWYLPDTSLPAAVSITLVVASGFGWVSWHLIERPMIHGPARWRE